MSSGAGSHDSTTTSSTSSIVSSIVFNVAIFAVFVVAFLILRPRQRRIYQPKSTVATIPDHLRPRPLASGIFSWITDLFTRPDSEIIQDAGLDGYFFLRYIRLLCFICLFGVVLLYPVLLAVYATGGNNNSGFDLLSFGNSQSPKRYYATVLLGWFFYGFILFTLYREMVYYIGVRQAVLTSPAYSNLISSRTILICTVPTDFLNEGAIASLFDGVKYVWVNRNQSKLEKIVKDRNKLANKIEGAEVKLLKMAVKNRLTNEKKAAKKHIEPTIGGDDMLAYVPDKKRPTYRLKPIIGKKVDTINYGSAEVEKMNTEIDELQQNYKESAPLNSAFVCFHTQEQAEVACQVLSHHRAFQMAPRHIGIRPDDVIWGNLRLFWWERLLRSLGAAAFLTALVIFWAIPVAFVGTLSNIKNLIQKLPWLGFLNNLPSVLFGLVSSILPTVLLAVLMMLLPVVMRLMGKISGKPSGTLVEYYVQNAYFAFQVVQVFLVTTIASGAASVVEQIINQPTSAMNLLAANLPSASNFYISYFLLQGFTACGGMLLQIVTLVLFYVLSMLLDNTPRKIWKRWNIIGGPGWGTLYPVYGNLGVIAITYALIAPILLIFAALTFGLLYLGYLHNLMFINMPTDGRGIFYCRAIFQTFTGLYISQVCMLGLFVVAKAWGPIVLQAICLGFTVFVHINMNSAYGPLESALPRNLLHAESTGYDAAPTKVTATPPKGEKEESPTDNQLNQLTTIGTSKYGASDEEQGGGIGAIGGFASKHVGVFTRYFRPHLYLTPELIQREFLPPVYHETPVPYTEEEESSAYANPYVNDPNPVVWIPKDPWGLSDIEVSNLRSHNVNASNLGTWFAINDQKKKIAKIETGSDIKDIPIWQPSPQY